MQESFNPNKTRNMDSSKTLETKFKVGDVIETADEIRTIVVEDVNDKLIYSVRVNHKDGSAKEYRATGPAILLAKDNPSTIMQWDLVRNIPIEESMSEAA